MQLTITEARPPDIPAIADILTSAFLYKLDHNDHSWGSNRSETFTHDEVAAQLKEDYPTYVMRVDGKPIGTFALQWQDERIWGKQTAPAGYIHRLAISEGLHGQKLGEQAINWAADEVKRRGWQFLRLDCDARNLKLCNYYEKQGFKRVAIKTIPEFQDYTSAMYERSVA